MKTRASLLLLAVVAVAAPGYAAPAAAAESDAAIAARVKEIFLAQRNADAADVRINVLDGVVILSGDVVNEEHKELAGVYASQARGVARVDNRLTVAGTTVSVKGTTIDKMGDAAVTLRVKTALLLHRSTRAIKTKVKTKDGVVTLSGRARSEAEKDRIGKLAASLDGVSAVDNRMLVEL